MTGAELAATLASLLGRRGETLAIAEASAGGRASSLLTAIPGSSAWFVGGVVAYSNSAKTRLLGVSPEELATAGAVSPEGALALARGARAVLGASWGAAETGIAGPRSGRRSAKPPGLAYVAVVGEVDGHRVERVREVETGLDDRAANQAAFAEALVKLVVECL